MPGYAALILRRTFPALSLPSSIMNRSHSWLRGTDAVWNEQAKRWTFPSGAVLQFGYCDSESDLERYKSSQLQFIAIDELTEWPELWYQFLFSRLRRDRGSSVTLKMRAATNPDGIGAEWVRARFGIPLGAIVDAPIWTGRDRVFIPARAEDNPSLDLESYDKSLQQLGAAKYQQLRWGRWIRDTAGLVYAYSDERNAVTEAPFDPAEADQWTFLLGLDLGFVDATAFVIVAWRKTEQTVYVVESHLESGLTPSDVAERVRAFDKRYNFERIVGDVGGLGKGYVEEARKRFNLPIEPAEKSNKRGYIDLINGDFRDGKIKIVRGRNAELLKELTTLPWTHDRSKEEPGFANHGADALLYSWRAARAFWEQAPAVEPERGTEAWVAAQAARMKEERFRDIRERAEKPWWQRGPRR